MKHYPDETRQKIEQTAHSRRMNIKNLFNTLSDTLIINRINGRRLLCF